MIRVFRPGVFDLFHVGHLRCIQEASKQGDYLIVGVQDDRDVYVGKGQNPVIKLLDRMEIIRGLKGVDKVISYRNSNLSRLLEFLKIDILSVGEDYGGCPIIVTNTDFLKGSQGAKQDATLEYCERADIKVHRQKRCSNISTTSIKNSVYDFWKSRGENKSQSSTMLGSFKGDEHKIKEETSIELSHIWDYVGKSSAVLDVGCGYGRIAVPLSYLVKHVVAIDYSETFIDTLKSNKLDNITASCIAADAYQLDYGFDLILFSGIFSCMTDDQATRTLRHLKGMLNKGGTIIVRSSVSLLHNRIEFVDQYSEDLNSLYTAFYRTVDEINDLIGTVPVKEVSLYQNHEDTAVVMLFYEYD